MMPVTAMVRGNSISLLVERLGSSKKNVNSGINYRMARFMINFKNDKKS
jgi:hypothetical protein